LIVVLLSTSLGAAAIHPVHAENAALSIAAWYPLSNQGLNFTISALAVLGDDLYVGGQFFKSGDGMVTDLNNIARYNISSGTWHALPNQRLDGYVAAFAVLGDALYVGVRFQKTFDGAVTDLKNIARLDTTSSTWYPLPIRV
jgi:N-acetylneuraminic acid mutarotase